MCGVCGFVYSSREICEQHEKEHVRTVVAGLGFLAEDAERQEESTLNSDDNQVLWPSTSEDDLLGFEADIAGVRAATGPGPPQRHESTGVAKSNDSILLETNTNSIIFADRALGYLEYSAEEVEGISTLLGGDQWLNEAATKAAFLTNAKDYQILHLAMHGTIDPVEPLNSSLIFTYKDGTEFLLTAADIYTMDLNANLVALSACNTAAGNWSSGTGPMSMARAFNYAGATALLASLWRIPDHSTASMMQAFYSNLKEGLPKDIALQKAKLSYLNDDALSSPLTRDPAFWAGPVMIGDVVPISASNKPWWVFGFMAIGLLLASFWWFRK